MATSTIDLVGKRYTCADLQELPEEERIHYETILLLLPDPAKRPDVPVVDAAVYDTLTITVLELNADGRYAPVPGIDPAPFFQRLSRVDG